MAVLGTLAEFHRESIPYDLKALLRLVMELNPDLLCLDMTREQWRSRDFGNLPPEYREALLPLAEQTDIVVVPLASTPAMEEPPRAGLRGAVIGFLKNRLAALQRRAPGPAAINQGPRHHFANLLYFLAALVSGSGALKAWRDHTGALVDGVIEAARRDEGSRILVVVNVRHCHVIRRKLRERPELEIVRYSDLLREENE